MDNADLEKRHDVLVFTSEPLQADVEVIGSCSHCGWCYQMLDEPPQPHVLGPQVTFRRRCMCGLPAGQVPTLSRGCVMYTRTGSRTTCVMASLDWL